MTVLLLILLHRNWCHCDAALFRDPAVVLNHAVFRNRQRASMALSLRRRGPRGIHGRCGSPLLSAVSTHASEYLRSMLKTCNLASGYQTPEQQRSVSSAQWKVQGGSPAGEGTGTLGYKHEYTKKAALVPMTVCAGGGFHRGAATGPPPCSGSLRDHWQPDSSPPHDHAGNVTSWTMKRKKD